MSYQPYGTAFGAMFTYRSLTYSKWCNTHMIFHECVMLRTMGNTNVYQHVQKIVFNVAIGEVIINGERFTI